MPLAIARPGEARRADGMDVVFVNNMPDGAFLRTETQLLGLLEAAAGTDTVCVRRYSLDGITRSPAIADHVAHEYLPLSELWTTGADAVLVSGSEPRTAQLRDEPYWAELQRLLEWCASHTASAVLSCLAAHAALAHFDGVERVRLVAKCSGTFPQCVRPHPLTTGVAPGVAIPHSRLNDVPVTAVRAQGYDPVIGSDDAGWTLAVKERRGCLLALIQGHPEYDPTSLLREYRRDARRFLAGEQATPPVLPRGCVDPADAAGIERFHQRICADRRDPAVLSSFPFDEAYPRAPWPWRRAATAIYTNWLAEVRRRTAAVPGPTLAGSDE